MRAFAFLIPVMLCSANADVSNSEGAPLIRLQVAQPVEFPLGQTKDDWKLKDIDTLLLEVKAFCRAKRFSSALESCDEILKRRPKLAAARRLREDVLQHLDSVGIGDFDTAHERKLRARSRDLKQSDSGYIGLKPRFPR